MSLLVATRPLGDDWSTRLTGSPRVAVVDRQPLFLEVLRPLLEAPPLCARVWASSDIDGALRKAADRALDALICDVRSAPTEGGSVVDELSRVAPGTPTILLGEPHELAVELPLLLRGAAGLVTKDSAPEQLIAAISAVLSGHLVITSSLLGPLLAPTPSRPEAGLAGQLSHAEREVLTLLAEARSVSAIAAARGISQKTVRNHMANIYRKLELRNRAEAMLYAARIGLVGGMLANGGQTEAVEAGEALRA